MINTLTVEAMLRERARLNRLALAIEQEHKENQLKELVESLSVQGKGEQSDADYV